MIPPSTSLSSTFRSRYNISKIYAEKSGGQKRVFIVEIDSKKYALKIFDKFGRRELREISIYEKYKNVKDIPKIIKIDDYDSETIIIESFIDGENLYDIHSEFLGNYRKISKLLKDIIKILDVFWQNKIVHRDLKPQNIIIKNDGGPAIIDFGIARDLVDDSITASGQPQPKSWKFAAPEQIFNQKDLISYRTDYFSLGVLSYYLCYDKLPFGQRLATIEKNMKNEKLIISCANGDLLKSFYDDTLQYSPAKRPRTSNAMLELLKI